MNKKSSGKLEDKLAIGLIFIIYALIMVTTYCIISYVMKGKLVQLVGYDSLSVLASKNKEEALSHSVNYMLNLGLVIEIVCILLIIGSTIFMVLFLIGMYKNIKRKNENSNT